MVAGAGAELKSAHKKPYCLADDPRLDLEQLTSLAPAAIWLPYSPVLSASTCIPVCVASDSM